MASLIKPNIFSIKNYDSHNLNYSFLNKLFLRAWSSMDKFVIYKVKADSKMIITLTV